MKEKCKLLIAGAILGIANIIPGVSGGTMAVVFGIYDRIISLIADFKHKIKEDWKFLLYVLIGLVISVFAFSNVMKYLLDHHAALVNCFFIGVMAGSMPLLLKTGDFKKLKISSVLSFLVTLGIMLVMILSGEGIGLDLSSVSRILMLGLMLVFGAVSSSCMLIPGISGSFVMVLIGGYTPIINALAQFDFLLLLPYAIGAVGGLYFCAKAIKLLFARFHQQSYAAIVGFVLGSVLVIFPPLGTFLQILPYPLIGIGFLIAYFMNRA